MTDAQKPECVRLLSRQHKVDGIQTDIRAGADDPRTPDRGRNGGKRPYRGVKGALKGPYW